MAKVSKTVGLKWKFKVFYRTVGNYMFKVNKRNTKNKLRHRHRSRVFIVNFKYFFTPCSSGPIVDFEQVNPGWVRLSLVAIYKPFIRPH